MWLLTDVTSMSAGNSGENQNYSEAVGTRLTPRMKRQFDQYKEANELGNSQALRELVSEGLEGGSRSARRDLADLIISFMIAVFGVSMILTYGLRTIVVAVLVGLLAASFVGLLKFGRYDIQVIVINRKKSGNGGISTGSGISFTTEPPRSEVPTTPATESDES